MRAVQKQAVNGRFPARPGVGPGRATTGRHGKRRRTGAALTLFPLLAATLAGCGHTNPVGLPCHAVAGTERVALDADQAANATTVAAVARRLGLPDHAVTIALAAALQESKLRNLPYGDQDSVGLFQQRPSQGWGTEAQIMSPRYAATSFYTRLVTVTGWETLPVTDAAQAVQRSAAPDAYARWEGEARLLARALTGEVPAGFACRTTPPQTPRAPAGALTSDLTADLGATSLGTPVDDALGWQTAGWLIAHAGQYGVSTVTFAGQRWSGQRGAWTPHPPPTSTVEVNQ